MEDKIHALEIAIHQTVEEGSHTYDLHHMMSRVLSEELAPTPSEAVHAMEIRIVGVAKSTYYLCI